MPASCELSLKKENYAFCGLWNKKYVTDIQNYQSKASLDRKILFGGIAHLQDPIIRKVHVRGLYQNPEFYVPFWSMV